MIGIKELQVVQAPPVVTLSAKASEMVRDILAKEESNSLALRVYVAGGGCSGLQYGMALDDPMEGDLTLDYDGIRVVVDSESLRFIEGAEIDYVDSLMGAGFTVNNPNAVSSCGCGHSFRTAEESGAARGCGCH
ncbi:MAG TPA: iron-sulfur cluster insertion protein ErpA [Chloroflexota bacterium]|nr:iron-sulfur cluster insertion protein ErpA [Chloroflexota bacterium]